MSLLLQLLGISIITSLIALLLNQVNPIFSRLLVLVVGGWIVIVALQPFAAIIQFIVEMANVTSVNAAYLTLLLKMIGIAYVTQFGGQLIRDAGQEALAQKVEFVAKIIILYLALPIVKHLFQLISSLFAGA
jgi:stage III sporulation protein AD